jgi:hypothetical protein
MHVQLDADRAPEVTTPTGACSRNGQSRYLVVVVTLQYLRVEIAEVVAAIAGFGTGTARDVRSTLYGISSRHTGRRRQTQRASRQVRSVSRCTLLTHRLSHLARNVRKLQTLVTIGAGVETVARGGGGSCGSGVSAVTVAGARPSTSGTAARATDARRSLRILSAMRCPLTC